MDRRDLLRSALGASALRALGYAPLILAVARPAAAAVDPYTATVLAISVVRAIREANAGDGGLGASLSAINGKLDLAIQQLASIQKSLTFIISELSKLDDTIADLLGRQYAVEKCNEMKSAANAWQLRQEEAQRLNISLEHGSANKGNFQESLNATWNEFDVQRRALMEWKYGISVYASTFTSCAVAIDAMGFGQDVMSEQFLAIKLREHVGWLERFLDPEQEYSAARELRDAQQAEQTIIENAEKEGREEKNFGKQLAVAAYRNSPAKTCVINSMEAEFYSDFRSDFVKAGSGTTIYVHSIVRDEVDHYGATFLEKVRVEREGNQVSAFYSPGRYHGLDTGNKAGTIDPKECFASSLPLHRFDKVTSIREKYDRYSDDRDVWTDEKFMGALRQIVLVNDPVLRSLFVATKWQLQEKIDEVKELIKNEANAKKKEKLEAYIPGLTEMMETGYFPLDEAQGILDQVNAQRLAQSYARESLALISDEIASVNILRAQLPDVSK